MQHGLHSARCLCQSASTAVNQGWDMPTQAEKDARIKAAWDAYKNGRTTKDENGVERARPYDEVKALWLESLGGL